MGLCQSRFLEFWSSGPRIQGFRAVDCWLLYRTTGWERKVCLSGQGELGSFNFQEETGRPSPQGVASHVHLLILIVIIVIIWFVCMLYYVMYIRL